MVTRYTHLKLNQDVNAVAGHYTPLKEVRLKYRDREVLYILSEAVVDASCCGTADYAGTLVPGYIVKWQAERNKDGLPISEVEPVIDKQARAGIRKIIRETEHIKQTEFW